MWYRSYGFNENPFSIRPDSRHLVGCEDKIISIKNAIQSGDLIALTGGMGTGKTSIIRHLMNWSRKNQFTPVFYDCGSQSPESFNMCKILTKRRFFGLAKRTLGKKDRVVFFCDEVQRLSKDKAEEIKAQFDSGALSAAVLSTIDSLNIADSMRSRIGENVQLGNLDAQSVAELIRKRTEGGINPFREQALQEIAAQSAFNPRISLINAERVCKALHTTHNKHGSIDADLVRLHLGKRNAETLTKPVTKPETVTKAAAEMPVVAERTIKEIDEIQQKLSPLQWSIIVALAKSNGLPYAEIAKNVGKSGGSVAKQLSRLSLVSDTALMTKKGVTEPLVIRKTRDGEQIFDLSDRLRFLMAKE